MEDKIITVPELQEKLNRRDPVFILDVRPEDERKEWHIVESAHVDAYKQLNAGDDRVLDSVDIPADRAVVTICAAGRTSRIAAKALRQRGIDAYSLEGGMKAWNYAWNTARVKLADGTLIVQVRRPAKGILSYMIAAGKEAIVIDAALDPDVYLAIARENGWQIRFVMDTHIHADFISRTRDLATASGVKNLLIDKAKVDFEFSTVHTGQIIKFGNAELQVLHTPGHTWESTSFNLADHAVFTGDTLFIDGIGRPDLKAARDEAIEKAKSLYHSLQAILSISSSALVLPAHTSGSISFDGKLIGATIGDVRSRLLLARFDEDAFVNYTLSRTPPTPPNHVAIAAINKSGSHKDVVLADLEAGGNHCAIAGG